MNTLRERLESLVQSKQQVSVNFAASAGDKLVSASGTVHMVGEDYFLLYDIYANTMVIPLFSMAYLEVKK